MTRDPFTDSRVGNDVDQKAAWSQKIGGVLIAEETFFHALALPDFALPVVRRIEQNQGKAFRCDNRQLVAGVEHRTKHGRSRLGACIAQLHPKRFGTRPDRLRNGGQRLSLSAARIQ